MPHTADLPLHGGRAPRWLFERMVKLARVIADYILAEFGPQELLGRLTDPFWFQSLGCVLGFDWHSSGLTTTTCGALKIALADIGPGAGVFAAGGKGNASRKIPADITSVAESRGFAPEPFIYASRMSAKVDSAGLQDGYQVYHQFFLWMPSSSHWTVIDQGMNTRTGWARRYHWSNPSPSSPPSSLQGPHGEMQYLRGVEPSSPPSSFPSPLSSSSTSRGPRGGGQETQYLHGINHSFVIDPHAAIEGRRGLDVLNMVSSQSRGAQSRSVEIASDLRRFQREFQEIRTLQLPERHQISLSDLDSKRISRVLLSTFESPPENFERLLGSPGVGPATIRALALVSQIIFGERPSYEDPVSFSFAHGGKDGTPFPVNRQTYDHTISCFASALKRSRFGQQEETHALRRLSRWLEEVSLVP